MMRIRPIAFVAALMMLAPLSAPFVAYADEASEIQAKIDQRSADIQSLEKDIKAYQAQITELGGQEKTLTSAIKTLDLTDKKLQADIAISEDKIDATTLRIQQLSTQIGTTQNTITDDTRFVLASFRAMNEATAKGLPEVLLSSQSIGDAWNGVARLGILQNNLQSHINELTAAKTKLVDNRTSTESAKAELVKLQNQLQGQKKAIAATRSEKSSLLSQTKSSEKSYKAMLSEKLALKNAFESEVLNYESQLKLAVNKANLPQSGSTALQWPLDKIIVTQFFGDTPFATANSQIYGGHGHDGIDFGASVGTPIKAARSGTIIGVSNTDAIQGCYSFGKWIMIKHNDGLSTLYAHMSVQSVAIGDNVSTGEVIGYSGNTGYTTGPHLHFGVYATEGTEIKLFTNSKHCKGATVPIAVLSAYLNPLSYLPALAQ